MTIKHVQTGTCFSFEGNNYMLETDENIKVGNLYIIDSRNKTRPVGRYAWGLDQFIYITAEIIPNKPVSLAIRKRECKLIDKF